MEFSLSRIVRGALLAGALLAATDLGARVLVRISPSFIEIAAAPGEIAGERIRYVNAGTEAVDVTVELSDFDVDSGGKAVELPPGSSSASLAPYFRITPTRVRAEPGQVIDFRYRIAVPSEFAQLRAMVYFVSRPLAERKAGASALVVPRMGVPLYVENRRASPADLEIARGHASADGGYVVLDLALENRGGRNLRPTGAIQVDTDQGPRFFQFNEGSSPVLPGHSREWTLRLGPFDSPARAVRFRVERAPGREIERIFSVAPPSQPS